MESRQQVIDMVNRSWPKDLIIRHLYVRLAPFFERDLEFFFADEKGQVEYAQNLPQTVGKRVICLSLCQFYQDVFGMFGINSKIITTNHKLVPHYALIVEGDKGWYFIDPLKDLMNNQAGLRTDFYGIIPKCRCLPLLQEYPYLIELPLEYRDEMDSFLGLYVDGVLNDYLKKLHLELTTNQAHVYLGNYLNQNLENLKRRELCKMKMLFLNQVLVNRTKIPGKIERAQYYNCLLCHILTHAERANMFTRCSKDLPALVSLYDSVYLDEKSGSGRVLRLEPHPSCEIETLLRESPKFRLY